MEEANFTSEQEQIFRLLNSDELYDAGIMHRLGLSNRRYYKIKSVVLGKVERIAREKGFIEAFNLR